MLLSDNACQVAEREDDLIRISELAAATGVSVATLKYYLREGLLPSGLATAPNQADYGERHVERVRLIRVLREVGNLGIDDIRRTLDAVDDPTRTMHDVLGASQSALAPEPAPAGDEELAEITALLDDLGWAVSPDAPDRRTLAGALASLRVLGFDVTADAFAPYARAVDPVARWEIDAVAARTSRDEAVAYAVVGAVVYERVLTALRRLAHEHHSSRRQAGLT